MNRLKSAPRTPASTYLVLIVATVIIAGGGVRHAMLKNRQIQTNREIDAIERRIEQYQLDIRTIEMRSDSMATRFVIGERLKEFSSLLRPIPPGLAEEVNPPAPTTVATTLP